MEIRYTTYLDELLKKAAEQQAIYDLTRRAQADTAAAQSDQHYELLKQQAQASYEESAAKMHEAYRRAFDANAVNEAVAQRHAEEAIANVNLANSGLNATQKTAISLSRGRADAETTRQRQAALDTLVQELDTLRTQYDQKAAQNRVDIYADAEEDMADHRTAMDKAVSSQARDYLQSDKSYGKADGDTSASDKETATNESDKVLQNSQFSTNSQPSLRAMKADAEYILRNEGPTKAYTYLNQKVNSGAITPAQRQQIAVELGVRVPQFPDEDTVINTVLRLEKTSGDMAAFNHLTSLYTAGLISAATLEKGYAALDFDETDAEYAILEESAKNHWFTERMRQLQNVFG